MAHVSPDLASIDRAALVKFVARIVGSVEDAEDVVQETYIRLLRPHAPFREEARLQTWVYAVAKRRAIDFLRSRDGRAGTPRPVTFVPLDEARLAAIPSPDEAPAEAPPSPKLLALIARLAPEHQTFLLTYLHGGDEAVMARFELSKEQVRGRVFHLTQILKREARS